MSIKRSLVMSGGAAPGAAWMLGMLEGLRTDGVDLGEADLIVGTSAGALAGAPLAGGLLDRAVAIYQRSQVPFFRAPATSEEFMAAAGRAAAFCARPGGGGQGAREPRSGRFTAGVRR